MIYPGSGSDVDEEIILEGPDMSPKSYVDEDLILEGPNLPNKSNVLEKVSIAPYMVSHSTKVSLQTSVKSTSKIQAIPQGVSIDKFEIGPCSKCQEL